MLDGLLGPYWKAVGLAFNCTFLLCGSVIQLIGCARSVIWTQFLCSFLGTNLERWVFLFLGVCSRLKFIFFRSPCFGLISILVLLFSIWFFGHHVPKFRKILISFLNLNMVFGPVISSSNLTVYGGGLRLKKFENTMTKKAKLVTHAWKLSNWPEHQGPQKILILRLVY